MDETALDVFSNWPSNKWVTAGGKSQDHTSSFGSLAYKVHKNTMGATYTPICTHSLVMMMLTYFIIILYDDVPKSYTLLSYQNTEDIE